MYASSPVTVNNETILDVEDEPVWHFLAAMAVSADMNQQQVLVTEVREKVLENVQKATRAKVFAQNQLQLAAGTEGNAGAEAGANVHVQEAEMLAQTKLRNVNIVLHALGLDASQITVD